MSNAALRWAFRLPLKGAQKAVLLALSDCLNDETKRCDPSNAALALFAGVDERTVRRSIRDLAANGLITITDRPGRSSQYTLAVPAAPMTPDSTSVPNGDEPRTPCPPLDGGTPDTTPSHPGHHARPTPDTVSGTPDTTPPKPLEPQIQPQLNPRGSSHEPLACGGLFDLQHVPTDPVGHKRGARKAVPEDDIIADEFDRWWELVPKKTDKLEAKKQFRIARTKKRVPFAVLQSAMLAYSRQFAPLGLVDPKFSVGPARWLRNEKWNDEPPLGNPPQSHPNRITPTNPTGRVVLPPSGAL